PEQVDGRLYYRLPPEGELPVLVATRMSLSFPLLISAVPLHEPARHHAAVQGNRAEPGRGGKNVADSMEGLASGGQQGAAAAGSSIAGLRRCWFSDGGISSNFPIHLFDAALPRWPTFAINLVYPGDAEAVPDPGDAEQALERAVVLPTGNRERWQRGYRDIASPMAATELTRFLFAIVATMQNWRDLLQARAPGYRDRIVHVALEGDEGGMNLDMPQEVLGRIAQKGTLAGERFCRFSFENHYWIRWRNAASAYQRYTLEVSRTDDAGQQVVAYRAAYASVAAGQPAPPSYALGSQEKRRQSQALYALMVEQGASWDDCGPDLTDGAPRPLPQMKVTPIY
ncbi:MAG: RpoH suppressor, partial [Stenotrophomonas sp.]|nr:RpoH suppressor [Stenotrophomonas sp.]